jgi:hypothetical protein
MESAAGAGFRPVFGGPSAGQAQARNYLFFSYLRKSLRNRKLTLQGQNGAV